MYRLSKISLFVVTAHPPPQANAGSVQVSTTTTASMQFNITMQGRLFELKIIYTMLKPSENCMTQHVFCKFAVVLSILCSISLDQHRQVT